MTQSGDDLRRDALARSLCARVCNGLRSEADLRRVDSVLTRIERGPLEMPLAIYVAGASSELERAAAAVQQLRSAGHEVVSTWLDTIATVGAANQADASEHQRRAWSTADLAEVERADALWFLVPGSATTRGAWVELGCAWSLGKAIVCSGTTTTQSIFSALGEEFVTDREALEHIGELAKVRAKLVAMRASVLAEIARSVVGDAVGINPADGEQSNARRPRPHSPAPLRAKTISIPPMPEGRTVVLTVDELFDDGGE